MIDYLLYKSCLIFMVYIILQRGNFIRAFSLHNSSVIHFKIRSSRALFQKIIMMFFKFFRKKLFFTMLILMFLPPNANPLGFVRHDPTSLPLQNCEDSFFARAYLKCLRHLPVKMLQKFQFPSKNILEKFIVFKTLLIS